MPTCPVNCIHPAPGEPGFGTSEMLYIDPETCIECKACVTVCPVGAIHHEDDLTDASLPFLEINTAFYREHPVDSFGAQPPEIRWPRALDGLRVAIVGSGPAGSYAAADLLRIAGVEVDVYERLLTPEGLVRYGVAPDHQDTKSVSQVFPYQTPHPRLRVHLGVEVGVHISHEELLQHHHAVIYAVGASSDRHLDIPGEDLAGSHSATDFVAWYNGHPDAAQLTFDLSTERAVVIGNGNVALDVARILASDPEDLASSDIADYALAALRESHIREVVVVGRRGPAQAAYSLPELLDLVSRPNMCVVALEDEVGQPDPETGSEVSPLEEIKLRRVREIVHNESGPDARRITLRYFHSPVELTGTDRVTAVRLRRNELAADTSVIRPTGDETVLETGLVLRAVGYRGKAIPSLPFDNSTGTVPNEAGRVTGLSDDARGVYVTGWIKRGPRGVIGTNKQCAAETVASLVDDFAAGRLPAPSRSIAELDELLNSRNPKSLGLEAWLQIDAVEKETGRQAGRTRVKFTDPATMLGATEAAVTHAQPKADH
ncbi:FAD-dependent oxidoreductase [Streptomyces sp. NPDC001978]|uniref:FAD-dependent oxidoreductase n=1 Tax=Streptomyces sp. NPDC001978 TaxID=3364627 RepID=UPI003699A0B8